MPQRRRMAANQYLCSARKSHGLGIAQPGIVCGRPETKQRRTAMAKYTFVVMTNPTPGKETEYNRWYNEQHIPDVLNVPGFVCAQRFRLADTQNDSNEKRTSTSSPCMKSNQRSPRRLQETGDPPGHR